MMKYVIVYVAWTRIYLFSYWFWITLSYIIIRKVSDSSTWNERDDYTLMFCIYIFLKHSKKPQIQNHILQTHNSPASMPVSVFLR